MSVGCLGGVRRCLGGVCGVSVGLFKRCLGCGNCIITTYKLLYFNMRLTNSRILVGHYYILTLIIKLQ